jgi:1-acyl-sn-glycerol-3-phosphate acyltransferase
LTFKDLPKGTWLIRLARSTYGKWVCRHYKLSIENRSLLDEIDGPFLLLANHTHIIDYIFISCLFPFHIRWVAGAHLFKKRFVRLIVKKYAQCISKEQGRSDISTVMEMKKVLKGGSPVGLFPEGTRTWDGSTAMDDEQYLLMAKLIRYLKVPVLFVNNKGGFACKPRWREMEADGPVTISLRAFVRPEEYLDMPIPDLKELIRTDFFFSNDEWQNEARIPYYCSKGAEGLQRVLYICPVCHKLGTHVTDGNTMTCSSCGAVTTMDEFQMLKSSSTHFSTIRQWHEWEQSQLRSDTVKFEKEEGVLFQIGDIDGYQTVSEKIMVSADSEKITVECLDVDRHSFHLMFSEISSIVITLKQTMELFIGTTLYRIRLNPDGSALKYSELHQALRQHVPVG